MSVVGGAAQSGCCALPNGQNLSFRGMSREDYSSRWKCSGYNDYAECTGEADALKTSEAIFICHFFRLERSLGAGEDLREKSFFSAGLRD